MGAGGKANHNTETMDDQTKYKIEKEIKKQEIVRNEFLYHGNSVGKYEFPIIRKQDIDVNIEGLEKYSEMTFYYKKKEAAVFFYTDEEVRLEWNGKTAIYSNTADFRQNARLDGKLLSEIWNDVERADYMQG